MATKTTIEIEDDLLVTAKQHAARHRTTLRTLVERGLRAELRPAVRRRGTPRRIRWVTADGGLPPGVDVADRAAMMDDLNRK
jgi:Arc/MetJ family transcription regulator